MAPDRIFRAVWSFNSITSLKPDVKYSQVGPNGSYATFGPKRIAVVTLWFPGIIMHERLGIRSDIDRIAGQWILQAG